MKVLMISTDRNIFDKKSASSKRMQEYAKSVDELRIIVFTRKKRGLHAALVINNLFVYPTYSLSRWMYVHDAVRIGRALKRADIVTVQDPFESGLAGRIIAKKLNVPLQVQVHTDFLSKKFARESFINRLRLILVRKTLKYATNIRVVSGRIKKSLISKYDIQDHKIIVLPVFVDFVKFGGESNYLSEKFPQFTEHILLVSRLEKEKNLDLAINAFKKIHDSHPKSGLIIVGDGSSAGALGELVGKSGLSESVVFVGWLHDTAKYYRSATLYLHVSNYEGYGVSLIEAASANCPIVTTNVGIVDEILINEESALVCKTGDMQCVVSSVSRMLGDKAFREKISQNAYDSIKRNVITDKQEYTNKLISGWELK